MQVILVTRELLLSPACTEPMLRELCLTHLGISEAAYSKMAAAQLQKPGKDLAGLTLNKVRTVLLQKFSQHTEHGDAFNSGQLRLPMECLATPQQAKAQQAGAKASGAGRKPATELKGAYWVNRTRNPNDPGKDPIWNQMWACSSFEEYFAQAPKKGITKTGRVITSYSEMAYAVKCGWIVPGHKAQTQAA